MLAFANSCSIKKRHRRLWVALLHFDEFGVALAYAEFIAAHGQFHGVAQRGYLAYIYLGALGQAHVHYAALERALAVQLLYDCVLADLNVLQSFHRDSPFPF